jgi:ADP-ribose pyrophosphatase
MTLSWAPQFHLKDVELLKEKTLFDEYCQIKQFELQFSLFGGGMSKPVVRELLHRPPAVAVLLYDPIANKVVLIEQLRVGALREEGSPWLLEIAAGLTEPDEPFIDTACREVKEETGCTVLSLLPICTYLTSPGISNEKTMVYCGQIKAPAVGGNHGLVEEGEDIKVWVFETEEAFKLLGEGHIISSSAIIALQWLKINQFSLRFPPEIE